MGGTNNIPSPINNVFSHPKSDPFTLDYGFAILQLKTPSNNTIVRLNSDPSVSNVVATEQSSSPLAVLGTGMSNALREATVSVISKEVCEEIIHPSGFPYRVGTSQFCAGDGVSGFCDEDWGGPLVIKDGENDFIGESLDLQVGLAAWVFGCRDVEAPLGEDDPPGVPGVYIRVSDGYEWIRIIACQNSVEAPAYLDCDNMMVLIEQNNVAPSPAPPTPITFRYHILNDGYLVELGKFEYIGTM